jgi:hypothetical protein
MDALSKWELHPILNVSILLILAGIGAWFLTRLDKEARRIVQSRQAYGYVIADYESEVRKWKTRVRLYYLVCTSIFLIGALLCAIPLFRL